MSYLHANAPRAVVEGGRTGVAVLQSTGTRGGGATKPKKYRDPLLEQTPPVYVQPNVMFDPRVARGTTAGKTAILASTLAHTMPREAAAAAMGGTVAAAAAGAYAAAPPPSRPSKQQLLASGAIRPAHPSVAYIHNHLHVVMKRVEVPMHLYLIEQKEDVLVHHLSSQTDALMAEPPAPAYLPRKSGVDTATQVDTAMVFDFDADVAAILEVVVSKTMEQSLMEVREEEERTAIEQHAQQLRTQFAQEEAEADERLRQERALFAAKEQMMAHAREQHKAVLSIRSKLAATYFSRAYLSALPAQTLSALRTEGFFDARDSVAHQLEARYMPDVLSAVDLQLSKESGARRAADEMLADNLARMAAEKEKYLTAKAHAEAQERERVAKERAEAEELERRQARIRVLFTCPPALLPADAAPLHLTFTGVQSVSELVARLWQWLEERAAQGEVEEPLPPREQLFFHWRGATLDPLAADTTLYDLGLREGDSVEVERRVPPPQPKAPKEKREKKEGDEEDEEEEEEEASEAEEKGEEEEEAEDEDEA